MDQTESMFQGSPDQDEQWRREPGGPRGRLQAVIALDGLVPAAFADDGPGRRAPAGDTGATSTGDDAGTPGATGDRDAAGGVAAALAVVVARHEILRTTFAAPVGFRVPVQRVHDALTVPLEVRPASPSGLSGAIADALAAGRAAPFDFAHGPLVHACLVGEGRRHALVLTLSTLVADSASLPVLLDELAAALGGPSVEAEPIQFADVAAWQSSIVEDAGGSLDPAVTDVPVLELPFTGGGDGASSPGVVPIEVCGSPDVVLAAWQLVLGRYGGQETVAVAVLGAARPDADLASAIGPVARPVTVLGRIDPTRPLSVLVGGARAALAHTSGGDEPVAGNGDSAVGAQGPVAAGFTEVVPHEVTAGGLRLALADAWVRRAPAELWLCCPRGDGARTAWIAHDPARHSPEMVGWLAASLTAVCRQAAATPNVAQGAIELVDGAARDTLLTQFASGGPGDGGEPVPAVVARHATQAAERVAVSDGAASLTYAELARAAGGVATALDAAGVAPGATVGLLAERSAGAIAALLGTWWAGAAKVPLHVDHPPARLRRQLAAARAEIVIADRSLADRAGELNTPVVWLDDAVATSPSRDRVAVTGEHLAYVMFTSGSTGEPKGVAVTHAHLSAYAHAVLSRLAPDTEPWRFGLVTSLATDLGYTSVLGALVSGGTLAVVAPAVAADAAAFARAGQEAPLDVLKITPSHLRALLAGGDGRGLPRRVLVLGGERLTWDLAARVRSLSDCAIVNHYGPTETTIGCCTHLVTGASERWPTASVPIGRPLPGARCYVLDERRSPIPVGIPGQLWVGGAGVADGYLEDAAMTEERFRPDAFAGHGRMYRTGDTVRWLPDGSLEFLGRGDAQVKIRGYRVEPAEVETALRAHPAVVEAAVVTGPGAGGETRLVAYCALPPGSASEEELLAHLSGELPEYMLPAAIVLLERLPRTASGKLDRGALPEAGAAATAAGAPAGAPAGEPPIGPVEQTIAEIWAQTLGVAAVGRQDDFFDLGGHSLLATQVVAQLRSLLAVELPLHALFTAPTVALLAEEIVALMGAGDLESGSALLAELEALSDEEVARVLAGEEEA